MPARDAPDPAIVAGSGYLTCSDPYAVLGSVHGQGASPRDPTARYLMPYEFSTVVVWLAVSVTEPRTQ
jgi:hypothetical protein